MKRRMFLYAIAVTVTSILAVASVAPGAERYVIPAGSSGGSVYTWMASATGLLNKHQTKVEYSGRSGGLSENIPLLQSGEVKVGVTSGFDYFGWTKGKPPEESDLRSVYMIMPLVSFIVLPADAPEKTLAELRGKTLQMGPRTSAMYPFNKMVMDALGLQESDYKTFALSAGAGAEAFAEGKVYANLFLTGLPRPPAMERMMKSGRGVKTVFYTDAEIQRITKKYPVIKVLDVPPGQITGVDRPVKVPAIWAELVVRKDFPNDYAYDIAKTLHEQYDALKMAFPPGQYSTAESTVTQSAFPLHPGVQQYFREKGLLKR